MQARKLIYPVLFLCTITFLARAVFSDRLYISDLARLAIIALTPLAAQYISTTIQGGRDATTNFVKIILLASYFQTAIIILQFFLPYNESVIGLTSVFSREDAVSYTWQTYGRSLGIFGGPAPSGAFCLFSVLSLDYLTKRKIIAKQFEVLHLALMIFSCILMASKAAIVFLILILLERLSHYLKLRILSVFYLSALIVSTQLFLAVFNRLFDRFNLSLLTRTSSLLSRIDMWQSYNISLDNNPIALLVGSDIRLSQNTGSRVFDSDFLYFLSTFGIPGLALLSLLLVLLLQNNIYTDKHSITPICIAMFSIVNPYLSVPIILPCYLFIMFAQNFDRVVYHHYKKVKENDQ